jgi:hypothetical protein
MSGGSVEVAYEIATDPEMRDIVRQGMAIAESNFAFSVHLEVHGLQSARPYWYRFRRGAAASRIGRAVTAPQPGSRVESLRFGFVSCSNYEAGYFSAYRHFADQHPDLVLFLGDYIYEDVYRDRRSVRTHKLRKLNQRHSASSTSASVSSDRHDKMPPCNLNERDRARGPELAVRRLTPSISDTIFGVPHNSRSAARTSPSSARAVTSPCSKHGISDAARYKWKRSLADWTYPAPVARRH